MLSKLTGEINAIISEATSLGYPIDQAAKALELVTRRDKEIDNMLVHQKDHVFGLIADGSGLLAVRILEAVQEMWNAAGYGYKGIELCDIIVRQAEHNQHAYIVIQAKDVREGFES